MFRKREKDNPADVAKNGFKAVMRADGGSQAVGRISCRPPPLLWLPLNASLKQPVTGLLRALNGMHGATLHATRAACADRSSILLRVLSLMNTLDRR
jgi:hypothetical protein